MFKTLLVPTAALALMAGSAIAAPVAPQSGATAAEAPVIADWGLVKQQVGFKRRGFRGHRRGFRRGFRGRRRFRGHRFGFRRAYRPYYYGGYYGGYYSGYRGGFGGFSVRGPGTSR